MTENTKPAHLCIDEAGADMCAGWYARYDSKPAALFLERGTTLLPVQIDVRRLDVMNAGLSGTENCGFLIKFMPRLKHGESFRIYDQDHTQLYEYTVDDPLVQPSANQYNLMELVEPFIDLDIKKIQQRLMTDKLYGEYSEMYRNILRGKTDQELREEWISILADLKTTQHLLCAAYLEQTRYKDPDFLQEINEQRLVPDSRLEFNLAGRLTGSNWGKVEKDGRWTLPGKVATMLLPRLPASDYQIGLSLLACDGADAVRNLRILLDGVPLEWTCDHDALPCDLQMSMRLAPKAHPFMTFSFFADDSASGATYKLGKFICSPL